MDTTEDYASVLRVIGQDVEDLLPLYLQIEVTSGQFIVRGRGLVERSHMADNPIENFLHKVWTMLIRRDAAADIVRWQLDSKAFARTYTQEELKCCNEKGAAQRKNGSGMPDIYSLGERLRIVGRILDAKQGQLLTLLKSLHNVSFQYLDQQGEIQSEEYSADDLYRMQQDHYANRITAEPIRTAPLQNAKNTIAA